MAYYSIFPEKDTTIYSHPDRINMNAGADEALELETLRSTPEELSVNVTRCKYAEYFASIGESEFGAMITCEIDPPMTEAIGSDLKLARSKTIASGGDHCDFRWVSEK